MTALDLNVLDLVLLLLVLAYAVSGYWQGFISGAFATAGLLVGGLIGVLLAPRLLGEAAPALWVSLAALFVVLVCASFGQALHWMAGVSRPTRTMPSSVTATAWDCGPPTLSICSAVSEDGSMTNGRVSGQE